MFEGCAVQEVVLDLYDLGFTVSPSCFSKGNSGPDATLKLNPGERSGRGRVP